MRAAYERPTTGVDSETGCLPEGALAVDPVKHFDLIFGGAFAALGMIGLIAGAVMVVVFSRRPPRERTSWVFVILPLGIGTLFTLIGGFQGGDALNKLRLEESLLASGVTVRATVVDVERTGSRLNGRYLWQVPYEYQDATGRFHEGVSGKMERIDAQRFRVGERVYVRYDPAEPSSSIWLGREDVAADESRCGFTPEDTAHRPGRRAS